ncbi:MAG: acetate/propionate family kinase, partial [Actinomycetota bacterium]
PTSTARTHPRFGTGPGRPEPVAVVHVLTVNAGSSSLKLRVLDDADRTVAEAQFDGEPAPGAVAGFVDSVPSIDAVGHRVVHGGAAFTRSVLLDDEAVAGIERLSELAPLHNPPAVAWIRCLARLRPGIPAVACFDTAFHAGMPPAASTYAIPWEWTQAGVRRFGFHGLSHAYAGRRAAELLGRPPGDLRIVSCHLGAGSSLAALAFGMSVDTTMGFTPVEGLVMATRSGSVDPGALLWLQTRFGLSPDEMADRLERSSGLLGISGISGDMRRVLEAAGRGDDRARLAIDTWTHRLRSAVGAMAAAMGGVDVVVFTGGVGEHNPGLRERVCDGLAFLGLALDPERNRSAEGDADLSAEDAAVRSLLVRAREDLEIAREVRQVLGRAPA